jgi:hypothetical protein
LQPLAKKGQIVFAWRPPGDQYISGVGDHRTNCYAFSLPTILIEELAMTEPTRDELMARIAELEKQAGSKKSGRLEFKVSEKGGVSVYGLGRFPVTLYYEQWIRLLGSAEGLRQFLEENKGSLKLKSE